MIPQRHIECKSPRPTPRPTPRTRRDVSPYPRTKPRRTKAARRKVCLVDVGVAALACGDLATVEAMAHLIQKGGMAHE